MMLTSACCPQLGLDLTRVHVLQPGLCAMYYVPSAEWLSLMCRLMRKEQVKAVLVPDEAPPLDRDGKPVYPLGWAATRPVRHERDIFELCGIPYKPPHLRNAP